MYFICLYGISILLTISLYSYNKRIYIQKKRKNTKRIQKESLSGGTQAFSLIRGKDISKYWMMSINIDHLTISMEEVFGHFRI